MLVRLGFITSLTLAVSPLRAWGGPEIRSTAVFSVGRDPSGYKAAAVAEALLRQVTAETPSLRLVEPGRILSGDPRTREEVTIQRARAAMRDGRSAYKSFALDSAIARLGQAVSLYKKTGPLLGDLREFQDALALLGASLVLQGSADEAASIFLELLTIDPSHELTDFPPTVVRVFEKAVRQLERSAPGGIEIFSTPPYAAVYLDGQFEGVTPLSLNRVLPGTHYLRLEKLSYTMYGSPINIVSKRGLTSQTRLISLRNGAALRDLAARAASEVENPDMGSQSRALARELKADTIIFVAVTQSGHDASFVGVVYDTLVGKRLTTERAVLSVSPEARFIKELRKYVQRLVEVAERGTPSLSIETARTGVHTPVSPHSALPRVSEVRRSRGTPTQIYLGWTLVGVGVAALGTGVGYGIAAQSTHNDFRDTPQNAPERGDIQDRGRTFSTIADSLYIGGGLAVVGGAALILLTDFFNSSPVERLHAGVTPTSGGMTATLGGTF